jgi:GMP synthase-like glutamine amidotransferase
MKSSSVLIIQNDVTENLGLYEEFVREYSDVDVIKAYSMDSGKEFPLIENYSSFIVGPTPISANDIGKHQFLKKEWKYLSEIIKSSKPVLGVCCGGQILAKLLGADVIRSPKKEVGVYTVTLTDDGVADPLFKGFPREIPVFHWHSEMFLVPSGGKLLAQGDTCPIQAYAYKNIRGIIFHLEISHIEASRWALAYPEELDVVGKTREEVLSDCEAREPDMKRLADLLVSNFLSLEH